jgi:hypothetical protein
MQASTDGNKLPVHREVALEPGVRGSEVTTFFGSTTITSK